MASGSYPEASSNAFGACWEQQSIVPCSNNPSHPSGRHTDRTSSLRAATQGCDPAHAYIRRVCRVSFQTPTRDTACLSCTVGRLFLDHQIGMDRSVATDKCDSSTGCAVCDTPSERTRLQRMPSHPHRTAMGCRWGRCKECRLGSG